MIQAINRRAVLASVPAIAAGTLPSFASTSPGAVELLPLWLTKVAYINGLAAVDRLSTQEFDRKCWPMDDLEARIMAAPIFTAQDMAAKVVVSTGFGAYDSMDHIREAASLLGQSHRIPKFLRA